MAQLSSKIPEQVNCIDALSGTGPLLPLLLLRVGWAMIGRFCVGLLPLGEEGSDVGLDLLVSLEDTSFGVSI